MINGIIVTQNVSYILVFLEGILSFFSPCVIPLIPVYMSYLAGGGRKEDEEGNITYNRKKVFLHTLFFVIGISFTFFILGMSFTALGTFFGTNKSLFTRIGGILIILLGLFQLGIFDFRFLQKERKIHFNPGEKKVNPLIALVMGFTFSFAWTPCIGPALSSVLIMASGASTAFTGNLLVFVYAAGFLIPFLLLGLFTTQILNFLKKKQKLLKYTIKAGGVILILIGIMIFTGWMNGISGYLNKLSTSATTSETTATQEENSLEEEEQTTENTDTDAVTESDDNSSEADNAAVGEEAEEEVTEEKAQAFDFTLTDQYGETHTLSDYKGKVVFLNFWATWCPPCKEELPDIEALYQEYNLNEDDVVFIGVTNPASDEYPYNQDGTVDEIKDFLTTNGYTFPTVFDETGEVLQNYNITAFPTTFLIDKEGNIVGYVPGMMTKDIMYSVINQSLEVTDAPIEE